jgi:glycosyltransferase involved in cell wall biosynthesis
MPRISIIIPAYNAAFFLLETLVSVKNQTYTNWECIIVDDGSTDDTAAIIEQYIATDKRFSHIYQSNKGLSAARNTGLQFAKGEIIQFLDADDVLLPLKFEKQLPDFENIDGDTMIVSYTDYLSGTSANIYERVDYHVSTIFYSKDYVAELISRWEATLSIPPHCFLFSANFFKEKKIQFDIELPNHEDFDCWLNIFMQHPQIKYVNEKLCVYRITDGSMSKKTKLMCEGFLQVLDKYMTNQSFSEEEKALLTKKRRAILVKYNRFDLMNWKDKILLFDILYKYYSKRIIQKMGLKFFSL